MLTRTSSSSHNVAFTPTPFRWHGTVIEPVFETGYRFQRYGVEKPKEHSQHRMPLQARRRDTWKAREEAAAKLRRTAYYAVFDPRVFERVVKYDLRDMPTQQHPHAVTLTTPKAQEVYSYARPDPPFPVHEAAPDHNARPENTVVVLGFYRGEVKHLKRVLPQTLPSILYLWGAESIILFELFLASFDAAFRAARPVARVKSSGNLSHDSYPIPSETC